MKKLLVILFLVIFSAGLAAQDFDLYFANNVGDVARVSRIKEDTNLKWKKISGSSVSGNLVDVNSVVAMFKEKRMKTRADQRLFWKMRDDNLLCFRINDGSGRTGEYEARVRIGQRTVVKDVSSYFFVNTQSNNDSLYISVCRKGCSEGDTLRFTYYVYDWDNEGLLLFKLDSKRQRTGLTYQLEYQLKGAGEQLGGVQRLNLSGSSFQSFYVAPDSAISSLCMVSEGNRLPLDQRRLVWGANLNDRLNRLWVGTNFTLDKHENRELTIFNMLGSGLFERYDTLYLQVLDAKGAPIKADVDAGTKLAKGFTFNVAQVDANGKYVSHGHMKYVGYNKKNGIHKILTYGNPAYIEVIATGYYPAVYKYAGAVDPKTKVLNSKHTSGVIRLISGTMTAQGPDVSRQMMYILKDMSRTYTESGTTYNWFGKDSCDLSQSSSSKTYLYFEDGGQKNKRLHPSKTPVDKYAEIGITYSMAKSVGSGGAGTADLYLYEKDGTGSVKLQRTSHTLLDGNEFPNFQRSYFQQRYSLVGQVPQKDKEYKLRLKIGDRVFTSMPYIMRKEIDTEEKKQQAAKEAEKFSYIKDEPQGGGDISIDFLGSLGQINWNAKNCPGFSFSIIPYFDPFKLLFELDITMSNAWRSKTTGEGEEERPTLGQRMRDRQKEVMQPSRFETKKTEKGGWGRDMLGGTNPATDAIKERNAWFMSEMDDIFKVESNKLGYGPYVTIHAGFGLNLSKNNEKSPIYLKALEGSAGYGVFMSYSKNLKDLFKDTKFPVALIFHANGALYGEVGLGFKTYNYVKDNVIYDRSFGFYISLEGTLKMGAGVMAKTNFGPADPEEIEDETTTSLARGLRISVGGRIGAKGSYKRGWVWPFESRFKEASGSTFLLMGAFEFYADVQSIFGFRLRGRWTGNWGRYWLWPDSPFNPMIPSYPNYKPQPKQNRVAASEEEEGEEYALAETLLEGVGYRAAPFFLGGDRMLLSHQQSGDNLNDDRLMEFRLPEPGSAESTTMKTGDGTPLPNNGHRIDRPHADKVGDNELVVYEEMTRDITAEDMAAEDLLAKDTELSRYNSICASHRTAGGQWQRKTIAYDETLVDKCPVMAMNVDTDNGISYSSDAAACLWMRGQYVLPQVDSLRNLGVRGFVGDLVLSVYDGEKWGEPQSIMPLTLDDVVNKYELLMRNDTVLAMVHMMPKGREDLQLKYVCKPVNGALQPVITEQRDVKDFSAEMVGPYAFVGVLHPADSMSNDIYVKEINMRGEYQNYGVDLDIAHHNPQSVTLVSDHDLSSPDDFAVVWKKDDNCIRMGDKRIATQKQLTMLNCSRLFLNENLQATPYVTLGCTLDTLEMTHYTVFLNNQEVTALYTLADPYNKESWLMRNTEEFYDDFNYTVSYPQMGMRSNTGTLPVSVNIYNSGATPITGVSGYINSQEFSFQDIFIGPYSVQTLTVDYELPEDFDGFLKARDVKALFQDGWDMEQGARQNRIAQCRTKAAEYEQKEMVVDFADVRCEMLGHEVKGAKNTVYVELTDLTEGGLNPNHSVRVGLYPDNIADVPIVNSAEVVLRREDFELIGDERKAYVELTVENLSEETETYLRARIYNDRISETLTEVDDNPMDATVENLSWRDNLRMLTLLPSELDDITGLPVVAPNLTQHRVTVTCEEGGVRISGLEQGDYVRIFEVNGVPYYLHSNPSSVIFVPIKRNGIYLLSTGREAFKFTFDKETK